MYPYEGEALIEAGGATQYDAGTNKDSVYSGNTQRMMDMIPQGRPGLGDDIAQVRQEKYLIVQPLIQLLIQRSIRIRTERPSDRESYRRRRRAGGGDDAHHSHSEKDTVSGQPQPFIAVFPEECMGQLASFGPTLPGLCWLIAFVTATRY
jgi:hypothetical protein